MRRNIKKGNYLYLATAHDKFKVGFSSDPAKRFSNYKTHNPDCNILGIFPVSSKKFEKLIQLELCKTYKKCQQPEWFLGTITNLELEKIINQVESQCIRN